MTDPDPQHAALDGEPAPAVPGDYRLLLPDGWFRILLEPEQRDSSVAALVDRQFEGVDNAPHLKAELRNDLLRRAAKAYRNGGIELYLGLQQAGPFTIPASLLVTLAPLKHAEPLPLDALARSLAESGPVGQEVSIGELASGPAVRVRKQVEQPGDGSDAVVRLSTSVEYHMPVPQTAAFLLLTFSTPLEPLADAMAGLFDAVADSLCWTE
ncbi:hypothetical protein [Streptomyces sp. NBC_01500]|uniref:hypothetical protein n=1 Tax=Streptomyces sp. NBC_01500 TaxID=2903886 RepID=UPI002257ECE6|nr:hypothetical protein [Streptomyces sp. NBC_01500]MCX4548884.1 hypothetical protein [Streptomyces sp. NBC_01500]